MIINLTEEFYENSTESNIHLENGEKYLWIVGSVVLFFLGMIGNLLSLLVLRKMRFWRKPALFFLAPLAVTDSIVLCTGLSRNFIRYVSDEEIDIFTFSDFGCTVALFVIYTSMQCSSWILVELTLERYLKTNFPFWYIRNITVKKVIVLLTITFIILVFMNCHFFFTTKNGQKSCGDLDQNDFESNVYVFIDLCLLSLFPTVLLIFMNIAISKVLWQSNSFKEQSASGQRGTRNYRHYSVKVTRMLLICSCYFILATMPVSIIFIVRATIGIDSVHFDLAEGLLYVFQFSNYAINFFLYLFANARFRRDLVKTLKCENTRYVQ